MIDVQALLEKFKNARPVTGLPFYANYLEDGRRLFAPEYGILGGVYMDADGKQGIFGPADFDVCKDCTVHIAGVSRDLYIHTVFVLPDSGTSIKNCFLFASCNPPQLGVIHVFPLDKMQDYPSKN